MRGVSKNGREGGGGGGGRRRNRNDSPGNTNFCTVGCNLLGLESIKIQQSRPQEIVHFLTPGCDEGVNEQS